MQSIWAGGSVQQGGSGGSGPSLLADWNSYRDKDLETGGTATAPRLGLDQDALFKSVESAGSTATSWVQGQANTLTGHASTAWATLPTSDFRYRWAPVCTLSPHNPRLFNAQTWGVCKPRASPFSLHACSIPSSQQLAYMFAFLAAGGVFLTLAFMIFLPMIVFTPSKFALSFTLGCLLIMAGFSQLRGWRQQLAHMFSQERLMFTSGEPGATALFKNLPRQQEDT